MESEIYDDLLSELIWLKHWLYEFFSVNKYVLLITVNENMRIDLNYYFATSCRCFVSYYECLIILKKNPRTWQSFSIMSRLIKDDFAPKCKNSRMLWYDKIRYDCVSHINTKYSTLFSLCSMLRKYIVYICHYW